MTKPRVLNAIDINLDPGALVVVKDFQDRMLAVQREFDAEYPDLDPDDPDGVFAAMMAFADKKIKESS